MMFINYIQHVHCDPNDPYNHSRNFCVGAGGDRSQETLWARVEQFCTFNAGFHQAHHDRAYLHWSQLPDDHYERLAQFTHPDLQCSSMTWYVFSTYFLGNLCGMKQYQTKQIGCPAWEASSTPQDPVTEPSSPVANIPLSPLETSVNNKLRESTSIVKKRSAQLVI